MSNLFDMTDLWNNVATTFTGLKLNVTDTASAAGSLLMDLQVGGASKFTLSKVGYGFFQSSLETGANLNISTNSGLIRLGTSSDVILARDAANTLALRNGTAAQKFNVYNTYTDASNYERGYIAGAATSLRIGTEALGTGVARPIQFAIGVNNVLQINTAGNLLWNSDNTYDIGATGANRPRNIYAGSNIYAVTNVGADLYTWGTTRSSMTSTVDGVIRMATNAQTDFTRLILGTNDANGIAIKKNGTAFNFVLGNDTGDAAITSSKVTTSATDFFHNTSAALANGAAAQVATMTNGPTAGNPTKWIAINDNGVTRYIPAW